MANLNNTRIVNRRPAQRQSVEGTAIQLYVVDHKPPGPWFDGDGAGGITFFDLPPEAYSEGSMVAVYTNNGANATYNQLYVYVENTSGATNWDPWKKVDVNWPKIDPKTGEPFDQFLFWYSPLAE